MFSLGTRLADGCTPHHFLGGISSMSVASLIFVVSILPAGFLTFYWMTKLGVGSAFKGQENRETARYGYEHGGKMSLDGIAWDMSKDYKPGRNWLPNGIIVFALLFFANAIVSSFLHDPLEGQAGWQHAIVNFGWGAAIWLISIGIIAGIGMAKTGFGTECAMMTPEISMGLKHDRKSGCSLFEGQLRISGATRYMFGSMSPFTAIFIEFVILCVAIMIGWQIFGRERNSRRLVLRSRTPLPLRRDTNACWRACRPRSTHGSRSSKHRSGSCGSMWRYRPTSIPELRWRWCYPI